MKVILTEVEIAEAIKQFIDPTRHEMGDVVVNLKATRGPEGFTAEVDYTVLTFPQDTEGFVPVSTNSEDVGTAQKADDNEDTVEDKPKRTRKVKAPEPEETEEEEEQEEAELDEGEDEEIEDEEPVVEKKAPRRSKRKPIKDVEPVDEEEEDAEEDSENEEEPVKQRPRTFRRRG